MNTWPSCKTVAFFAISLTGIVAAFIGKMLVHVMGYPSGIPCLVSLTVLLRRGNITQEFSLIFEKTTQLLGSHSKLLSITMQESKK